VRGGRSLGVLAGVSATVLAAGCGTQHAQAGNQPVGLAAAVSHTRGQTARIAVTFTSRSQGMTVSFGETGLFDFARSRGTITMRGPASMTELFVPPTTYLKIPATAGRAAPKGKTWLALPTGALGGGSTAASALLGPSFGADPADPADLLASLTAVSTRMTRIGASTIRGVPVTGFAVKINPAKAAAKVSGADRAGLLAFLKSLGPAAIPVDVWVDSQNLVRREKLSLTPSGDSGAPAGTSVVMTTDFYDFGVPVHVSAPPAAEVADLSQLAKDGGVGSGVAVGSGGFYSGSASGSGSFTSVSASPPRVSGTLTAAEAAAAEQAVAAFWSALGRNKPAAVARTVLPAQRSCVQSELGSAPTIGAPTITVSSLHVKSAQAAGDSSATVRFTVQAKAKLGGADVPVMPQGPGNDAQWLVTTEVSGRWYVDIVRSTALLFGGLCS
jgi:hypothetical protein